MFWPIRSLPADVSDRLVEASSGRAPGLGGCYFKAIDRTRRRLVCLALAVAIALAAWYGALVAAGRDEAVGAVVLGSIAVLPTLWAAVLLVESVRAARSRVRPFVLLTPSSVVRADFDHGFLEAAALRDATDFSTVIQYDGKQRFKCQRYEFKFPGSTMHLEIADAEGIARADEVIARARARQPAPAGDALVPPTPGLARLPALRAFSDPFGAFWLVVAAILCVAAIVGIIIARR